MLGSPPLTRGIRLISKYGVTNIGFTPAHAGNTDYQGGLVASALGSPPLTRGILGYKMPRALTIEVHPRSRGEYLRTQGSFSAVQGSPPLTRGIHDIFVSALLISRFTPAHAGNTRMQRFPHILSWVHPRSRGEYDLFYDRCDHGKGSPPLTRGIHLRGTQPTPGNRFTPAHAGNTL